MDQLRGVRAYASVPGALALAIWTLYLLLALKALPDVPHRMLISGFFGLLAGAAVVLNLRHWRLAVLLASVVYLVVYAVLVSRMILMMSDSGQSSLLPALSFYYGASWSVAAGIFQEKGLVQGLIHGFVEYAMPVLNVVLIAITLISSRPR